MWFIYSTWPYIPQPWCPDGKGLSERAVARSKEKECSTNLVGILQHQLSHFAGTAVCGLDDQPAGIVLLCGLRQQLLQHRDDGT